MIVRNLVGEMAARGMVRVRALQAKRGKRGMFWRMCQCGEEFIGIGRNRKVRRRQAEEHIQRCRARARARAMETANG